MEIGRIRVYLVVAVSAFLLVGILPSQGLAFR